MKINNFTKLKFAIYLLFFLFLFLTIPSKIFADYTGPIDTSYPNALGVLPTLSLPTACPTDADNIEIFNYDLASHPAVQSLVDSRIGPVSYKEQQGSNGAKVQILFVSKTITTDDVSGLLSLGNRDGWTEVARALNSYPNSDCYDSLGQTAIAQRIASDIDQALASSPSTSTTNGNIPATTDTNTGTPTTTTTETSDGITISYPATVTVNTPFDITVIVTVSPFATTLTQHVSLFASTAETVSTQLNKNQICAAASKAQAAQCQICHPTELTSATNQFTGTMNLQQVGQHRLYAIYMNIPSGNECQTINILGLNNSGTITVTAATTDTGTGTDTGTTIPKENTNFKVDAADILGLTQLTSLKGLSFPQIAQKLFEDLLGFAATLFVGLLAFIGVVVGGFQMITAAGNEEQAKKGLKTLTYSIIAIFVAALSYTIVVVVINFFKGNI